MSANLKDGGPVSPCLIPTGGAHTNDEPAPVERWQGMSLRDYFAAKAMAAFIGGTMKGGLINAVVDAANRKGLGTQAYIAAKAYEQADAMLKARDA